MKNRRVRHNQQDTIGGNNFLVSIKYQDNTSWQGTVQWLESGETIHFRSALELINLIQDGVGEMQLTEKSYRTWKQNEVVSQNDAL